MIAARSRVANVDVALEPLLVQVGQIPDVIDVRVAQDHRIHRGGFERKIGCADRLLPFALIQAAVQQ